MGSSLTVVVPTRDAASTLPSCLESLACQGFRDFEVLLMDGASKDETLALAESYRDRLPRLQVESERDGGIYQAMNRGLAQAGGEFVMFLGSDDAIHGADVFEGLFAGRHRRALARGDLVYGDAEIVPEGKLVRGPFGCARLFSRNICHQCMLYRTDVLRSIGGYRAEYRALADWLANVRLFCTPTVRVRYVPEVICFFRSGGFHVNHREDPAFYEERDAILNGFLRLDSWEKVRCRRWWRAQRDRGFLSGRAFGLGALLRRVAGVGGKGQSDERSSR